MGEYRDLEAIAAYTAMVNSDGLEFFRPMPRRFSPQEEAVESPAQKKLLRGGNRSGKSTIAAAMVAAFARDVPIKTEDGREIHIRRPDQRGRPMVIWIVGYDWDHVGKTLHRLLFQKNEALRIITDEDTGALREYRPWDPADIAREKAANDAGRTETQACPPLIPEHELVDDSWVFKVKGSNVFSQVTLRNGTVIFAHSSKEAKAGDAVDLIWVDEKVEYEENVAEWLARLADRRGLFLWSTWPASTNKALRDLMELAKEEDAAVKAGKKKKRSVAEWRFRMSDNPHIPEESKEDLRAQWRKMGLQHLLARDEGEFVDEGARVYPRFDPRVCSAIIDGEKEDEVSRILRKNNLVPPATWARHMILDPGSVHPFLLFVARTPTELGDYHVPYFELALPGADANVLMQAAVPLFAGFHFQQFIIDSHAGKQTPMGFGKRVMDNYSRYMRKYGIASAKTGHGWFFGNDNFPYRKGVLESWMHVGANGLPKLRIVLEMCPNLVSQLERVKMNVIQDLVDEKKKARGEYDGVDCMEYYAASDPAYEPPVFVQRAVLQNPVEEMKRLLRKHLYKGDGPRKSQQSVIGACGDQK